MSSIRGIELPLEAIEALRREAFEEGYTFVETTVTEWASGCNRFDGRGELLCGCFEGDVLIGVGGLTLDPFVANPAVGRLRRIYVRAAWRGRGFGEQIVRFLLAEAKGSFLAVRLRAENERAARLYERLGFRGLVDPEATHELWFDGAPQFPRAAE